MSTDIEPTPEGLLLENARKNHNPSMNIREAARRAGISEGRWRQIAKGGLKIGGEFVAASGKPETIAAMAHAVGVSAQDLRDVGREDAAKALGERTWPIKEESSIDLASISDGRLIRDLIDLSGELQRRLSAISDQEETEPERPPLHLVAREIDGDDESTFERDD